MYSNIKYNYKAKSYIIFGYDLKKKKLKKTNLNYIKILFTFINK